MIKSAIQIAQKMLGRPSCEEVNRFLAEYIEGALDDETQTKFDRHLSHCKCCGSYLDDYRSTIEMAHDSEEVAIPPLLADHTIEFLRSKLNGS